MGTIKYKVDVLKSLKAKGWTTYRMRDGSILSQGTQQKLRHGEPVNFSNLAKLCDLLQCQPGDLLLYDPDAEALQLHSNLPGHQDDKKGDAE